MWTYENVAQWAIPLRCLKVIRFRKKIAAILGMSLTKLTYSGDDAVPEMFRTSNNTVLFLCQGKAGTARTHRPPGPSPNTSYATCSSPKPLNLCATRTDIDFISTGDIFPCNVLTIIWGYISNYFPFPCFPVNRKRVACSVKPPWFHHIRHPLVDVRIP
jgi:hypothetical protein